MSLLLSEQKNICTCLLLFIHELNPHELALIEGLRRSSLAKHAACAVRYQCVTVEAMPNFMSYSISGKQNFKLLRHRDEGSGGYMTPEDVRTRWR